MAEPVTGRSQHHTRTPLGDALGHLRDALQKAEELYKSDPTPSDRPVDEQRPRKVTTQLLYTLQRREVALDCPGKRADIDI
jgi:hypothetical protein